MQRKASPAWQGGRKDGKGTLTTGSKVLRAEVTMDAKLTG
jgi:hypothetical protein